MRIDILTLFPETLGDVLSESILGRAQERGYISIDTHQIRDYTANKQNQVDDYPYGGGRGAVMAADPLYRCWEAVCDEAGGAVHTVYLSPCGHTFCQADAIRRDLHSFPTRRSSDLWSAATMRALTSVLSTNAWTRKFPWGISSSPAGRSPPWQ